VYLGRRGSAALIFAVCVLVISGGAYGLIRYRSSGALPSKNDSLNSPIARPTGSSIATVPIPTSTSTTTTSTTIPAESLQFTSQATSYLASRQGSVSVAVYDLENGTMLQIGPKTPQDEASIVKVDILEALLAQQPTQNPVLSYSLQSLATSMIEDSNNDSATSLWDQIGAATGIGAFNSRVGLSSTTPSPCVACAGFPWPGWGLTTTSAADQIALLKELVLPSSLLSKEQRDYALGLMENIIPSEDWGVSQGVAAGVTVALKNGWLPLNTGDTDWQINTIGWVSGDGRNYLIAVLSTGDPSEEYGIATVGQVASIAWADLA